MARFEQIHPNGSTSGRNVKVAATATPGTGIHSAHATALDRVQLEACNTDTSERVLVIECGGVLAADQCIITMPPESGWIPVLDGYYTEGVGISAFASAANVINIRGDVTRIS